MKYNNITYITELIIRFLKEKDLYNNFIQKIKQRNGTLKLLTQYNRINDILSVIKRYAIDGSNIIMSSNDPSMETKQIQSDLENYLYENIHKKNKILLFHQFLDDNNIRKQFYDNLKRTKETYSKNMNGYYSELNMLINDSFEWENSTEGFEFWSNKHQKLQEYANEIIKKGIIRKS